MGRAPTGSLRKLPSGRWQVRYTDPDGERRGAPTTFLTKRDANAWLAGVTADMSRGVWTPTSDRSSVAVTFRAYAEHWVATRKVKGAPLSPRTRDNYEDALTRLLYPTFGSQRLHTITFEQVEAWYDRPEHARVMRARAYSLFRTILNSAVDDGHLSKNPARIRGAGKAERRHDIAVATTAQIAAVVEASPAKYRLMVELAAWCALRYGELAELRRADIDTAKGVVRVRRAMVQTRSEGFVVKTPKTKAGLRDVAIPPHLMPAVREHLLAHTAPGADGLLFPSPSDPGVHMRQASMCKWFIPARTKAGRPDLRFHDLRHTGATMAAQTGATIADLMARLGHSTPEMALRYQHSTAERDALIATRLSEKVTG